MKNEIDKVLSFDPLAQTEKMLGNKHWSEFTEDENKFALGMAMFSNQHKDKVLEAANDTHFSMTWSTFLHLLKEHGFKCGLKYDILHDENEIDEAIIYYREDGLIIWATSYWNKKSVNGGTLYGEFLYDEWNNDVWNALSGCSNGSIKGIENGRDFSKDVREGMFHTINKISTIGKLNSTWLDRNKFLWFVDYVEDDIEGYNYRTITQSKIERLPEEARKIIGR